MSRDNKYFTRGELTQFIQLSSDIHQSYKVQIHFLI